MTPGGPDTAASREVPPARHEPGRTLYLDPWTGLSGDMLLAALLDTDSEQGELERVLRRTIEQLGLDPRLLSVNRVSDRGVRATRVEVGTEVHPPMRHLSDMEGMLAQADLPKPVGARSRAALRRLAEVEASIHGTTVDEVHFHEVGAVDTIVDVVGFFALLDALQVETITVGTIPVGGGSVRIEHGSMSVPAPATAELLRGFPIVGGPEDRELTTPTGALLVGQAGARAGSLPPMVVERIGYGSGSMRLQLGPNVLRAVLGLPVRGASTEDGQGCTSLRAGSVLLETNLDDVSPEAVAYACEMLRQEGALDVWMTPAFTKKQRPGMMISVLCSPQDEDMLVGVMFQETGTLGIRRHTMGRYIAERGFVTVDVEGSPVAVKWGRWMDGPATFAAEYEEAKEVSERTGTPLREVMDRAAAAARRAAAEAVETSGNASSEVLS